MALSKASKNTLGILAVAVLAVGGGLLGSTFNSTSSSGGSGGEVEGASTQGSYLDEIKARGVLRVGVPVSPPHTIELPDGSRTGPNLLPLRALAEALDVEFEAVPAEWKNVVTGLQAGRYDFAANLDRTLERSLAIQFTEPVWSYPAVFVVKAESSYKTLEDIITDGGPIGTPQGTAYEVAFDLSNPDANTVPTDTFANLAQSLRANRIIAYVTDLPTAISQAQEDSNLKLIVPDPDLYRGLVAYGVQAHADSRSIQMVNIAIERALNDGTLEAAYAEVGYLDETQLADAGLLK